MHQPVDPPATFPMIGGPYDGASNRHIPPKGEKFVYLWCEFSRYPGSGNHRYLYVFHPEKLAYVFTGLVKI